MEATWRPLGIQMAAKRAHLETKGRPKDPFGAHLEPKEHIWSEFGGQRAFKGPIWSPFGFQRAAKGPIWSPFGGQRAPKGAHLEAIWRPSGTWRCKRRMYEKPCFSSVKALIFKVRTALEGTWRALGGQFETIWPPFGLQVAPGVHLDRPKGAQQARQGGPKGNSGALGAHSEAGSAGPAVRTLG